MYLILNYYQLKLINLKTDSIFLKKKKKKKNKLIKKELNILKFWKTIVKRLTWSKVRTKSS